MIALKQSLINDKYPIVLTEDRYEFHRTRVTWEKGRLDSCCEHMKPGMVIFDVGAESGDFTALYHQWVGPSGTVVPIEPQPAYWPQIRANWEANDLPPLRAWFPGFAGDITTVHHEGMDLYGWPEDLWPTCSIGEVQPDFGFKHIASQASNIPMIRLDAFAERNGLIPDAVVVDVEGAEGLVLLGMTSLFTSAVRPLVWVSVHDLIGPTPETSSNPLGEWYGHTRQDLHNLMAEFNYVHEALPNMGEIESFVLYRPR